MMESKQSWRHTECTALPPNTKVSSLLILALNFEASLHALTNLFYGEPRTSERYFPSIAYALQSCFRDTGFF